MFIMISTIKTWITIFILAMTIVAVGGGMSKLLTFAESVKTTIGSSLVESPPTSYDVEITLDQEYLVF